MQNYKKSMQRKSTLLSPNHPVLLPMGKQYCVLSKLFHAHSGKYIYSSLYPLL